MDGTIFPADLASAVRDGTAIRQGVADVVYNALLDALHAGKFTPGQRINDLQVAEELGVSRTPVREALQRLREIGVVESAPNRFTRIADVSIDDARKAVDVWAGMFVVLLDEVEDRVTAAHIRQMKKAAAKFVSAAKAGDSTGTARAHFDFYGVLVPLSNNPFLLKGIESVEHVVWLGTLALTDWIDKDGLAAAHTRFIEALEKKNSAEARAAVEDAVRSIQSDTAGAAAR